jgi:aryl-alcohol dehydrogenase-like predicted oxidoreductase
MIADPGSWLDPKPPGARPALVVGTMNFGKRTPADESVRIIHRALERGHTWFDTANVYCNGESERILGRALKEKGGRRGEARIATKVGIGKVSGPPEGLAPARVVAALDESLARLGTDHVELYYLHAPDPKTPFEDTVAVLEAARQAGKIGAWGVSNFASWQVGDLVHLCAARGWARPRVSQVIYNLLIRQLDVEYFAFAKAHQVHTTVYNPLAGGLLAGKGLDGKPEPGSRFEQNAMYRKRYLSDRFFELARAYAALAADSGLTSVQLAYAWTAQRPGVDSILLGPATVAQLDAGLDGCALPLPPGVASKVDELHRAYLGTEHTYAR